MRLWAALGALALAAGLMPPAAPAAHAQSLAPGLTAGDNGKPIEIEADDGIEWQQNNRVYIARGNARATRGQATVFADTLIAYYRPICSPEAQAAAKQRAAAQAASASAAGKRPDAGPQTHACPAAGAAQPADATAKPKQPASDTANGGATEIYRLEADGHVRIATETQTVYGDHAVEDLDKSLLVVTGKHLKLETPRDTVTARDSLEWYDDKQLAVARGDAVEMRDDKRLAGNVLTAEVEKDAKGASHISRIDAQGNVLVSSADQIARGDAGVYNLDTGIATLTGRVTLTRGDNELRGQYGVVDLNNNVSRLLSAPPSAKLTEGSSHTRVAGLLVPRAKPTPPGASAPAQPNKPR
ncbi:MAG TPA: LptA/OstA family protein [Stellaceae bacterium]|nr:LptA/OstA family protein [Stellaceae bacterium]